VLRELSCPIVNIYYILLDIKYSIIIYIYIYIYHSVFNTKNLLRLNYLADSISSLTSTRNRRVKLTIIQRENNSKISNETNYLAGGAAS